MKRNKMGFPGSELLNQKIPKRFKVVKVRIKTGKPVNKNIHG